jgi:hypothetical protein
MSTKKVVNRKRERKTTNIGFASVIEQTHRFTIAGICRGLNFIIKCSIHILDQSKFNTEVIENIYKDSLTHIEGYFKYNYPIDYRPTSKEELMTLKRELNKTVRDTINTFYEEHYAKVAINSLLLWDEGYYTITLPFISTK